MEKKRNCSSIQREIMRQRKRQKRTGCGNGLSSPCFRYARTERKSRMWLCIHREDLTDPCWRKVWGNQFDVSTFRESLYRRFLHELVEKNPRLLNNRRFEMIKYNLKCGSFCTFLLSTIVSYIKIISFINIWMF